MLSQQERITNIVETWAESHGLDVFESHTYANTGRWFFHSTRSEGGALIGVVTFDFQCERVTLIDFDGNHWTHRFESTKESRADGIIDSLKSCVFFS
jgi:hypothetical protein